MNASYLTASFEVFGGTLSLVLAICLLVTHVRHDGLHRLIACAFLLGALAQLSDAISWLVEGTPGPTVHLAMQATVFTTFACDFAHMGVLVQYMATYVGRYDRKVSAQRISRACWGIAGLMIALLAVNAIVPVLYTIDAGNVYRETGLWTVLSQGALLVFPIYGLFAATRSRKRLNPFAAAVLIIAPFMMGAAYLAQALFGDLPISYLAQTACTVLLYAGVQADVARAYDERQLAIERLRTDLLLSQIRPHFLYNVIATIHGLVDIDPREAQKGIREFGAYLRSNVDALEQDGLVPFQKELDHVRIYLALERRRFGDRIVVEEAIGPTGFDLPALTVQPLVENAVRHGLADGSAGMTVRIAAAEDAQSYLVEVADDGAGFDPATGPLRDGRSHVGLAGVRRRVSLMCGGALDVVSSPQRGTAITVRIPKTEKDRQLGLAAAEQEEESS